MKASLIFTVIGLAVAGFGAWLLLRAHRKVEGRPVIQGQVIELIPVRGSKGGTSYKLRVAYRDPAGNSGTLTTRWAQNPRRRRKARPSNSPGSPPGKTPCCCFSAASSGRASSLSCSDSRWRRSAAGSPTVRK